MCQWILLSPLHTCETCSINVRIEGDYAKPSYLYFPQRTKEWGMSIVRAFIHYALIIYQRIEQDMLKEFKTVYDLHRWVRYLAWGGLGSAALFLLWAEDGFPPPIWQLLAQKIQQTSFSWATRGGIAVLFPFSSLAVLSLLWLLAWILLLWVSLTLFWPRKYDARHVAWRESRNLTVREVLRLDEDTLQEDTVNIPRLNLPHKAHLVSQIAATGTDSSRPTRQPISNGGRDESVPTQRPIRQSILNGGCENAPVGTDLSRPRAIHAVNQDAMNRSLQDTPQQSRQREQAATQPVLVATGSGRKARPTTPLPPTPTPRTWQRQRTDAASSIDDVPTTPERSSRTGVLTAHRQTKLNVGVGWNSGITRRQRPNEDSLVVLQGMCTYNDQLVPFGLFVVADGMGGHDFGQEASHIAIQSMMQTVLRDIAASASLNDTVIIELLVNGVEKANTAICQRCREWRKDMGTTLTAALIVDTKVYVVNVGDSRTYLYDETNGLSQITLDHSLVANLVIAGVITPEEVYTHPERNKVYRSLGNRDGVEVDWFTRDLRQDDSLLLCSDGLWEMVRDPDIRRIVGSGQEPTQVCDMLVQAALRNGGEDNVSAVIVKVE